MFLGLRYAAGTIVTPVASDASVRSQSLARSVADFGVLTFDIDLRLSSDEANEQEAVAKLLAHWGRHRHHRTFKIPMPQPPTSAATDAYLRPYPTGTALVLAAQAAAGGTTLSLRKTSSADVRVPAGRFVRFTGANKIHVVQIGAEYDDATAQSIVVEPALTATVASGSTVQLSPMITVRYAPEYAPPIAWGANGSTLPSIQLEEAL